MSHFHADTQYVYRATSMIEPTRQAAHSIAEWLAHKGEGISLAYLRELQWLRPSAGGEIVVIPDCFRPVCP